MLFVGTGRAEISAPAGTPLGGYWGRKGPASGAQHDPLFATAMLFQQSATEKLLHAVLALDLVGVDRARAQELRRRAAGAVNEQMSAGGDRELAPERVFLACSHTHSGPQTHGDFVGMGDCGGGYFGDILAEGVASAFRRAAERLRPVGAVRVVLAEGVEGSVNRRERLVAGAGGGDGGVCGAVADDAAEEGGVSKPKLFWFENAGLTKLGQRWDGPVVRDAHAIVYQDEHGENLGSILHFACHPTAVGLSLVQSADYIASARQTLEAGLGGALTVFLQGCCGDVNPAERKGGIESASRLGHALGSALLRAMPQASSCPAGDVAIHSREGVVALPLQPLTSRAEAEAFRRQQDDWLAEIQSEAVDDDDDGDDGIIRSSRFAELAPRGCQELADRVLAEIDDSTSALEASLNCSLHVLRLSSSVVLLGMEGEPFCEYQINLQKSSPFATTLVVGYVNGCVGYLPTEAEFSLGGYECIHAHRVYGQTRPFKPEIERLILQEANTLLADEAASALEKGEAFESSYPHDVGSVRRRVLATAIDSSFADSHDTYNSICVDSDGTVFYALSSARHDVGARVFKYRPSIGAVDDCGDLTAACGQLLGDTEDVRAVVQGKSHVPFFEDGDELIFATHVGYYGSLDGMEVLSHGKALPKGWSEYPGGRVLSLNRKSGNFTVLGHIPEGEGGIALAVDVTARRCFVLMWPSARLAVFEMGHAGPPPRGTWRDGLRSIIQSQMNREGRDPQEVQAEHDILDGLRDDELREQQRWAPSVLAPLILDYPGRGQGESVHPRTGDYRSCCRSMVVDPRTHMLYFTNADGDVLVYDPSTPLGKVEVLLPGPEGGLQRDYLGTWDPSTPGSMAYHWRQVWFHPGYRGGCILGVHGGSGYMFCFFPPSQTEAAHRPRLELMDQITSDPSRQAGVRDLFTYGYLGFALGQPLSVFRDTVFYLTGGPIFRRDGSRIRGKADSAKGEARGEENLHLVTFDLETGKRKDHGPIFFRNRPGHPSYVNSLAVAQDGTLYALARFENGRTDLMRIDALGGEEAVGGLEIALK